jgi:hypothetical protein
MTMTGRDESDDNGSDLGKEFGFGMIGMVLMELGNL